MIIICFDMLRGDEVPLKSCHVAVAENGWRLARAVIGDEDEHHLRCSEETSFGDTRKAFRAGEPGGHHHLGMTEYEWRGSGSESLDTYPAHS